MRDIDCKDIAEAVAKLAVEACCILPEDVVESFRAHQAAEPSPVGRNILQQLLDNAGIAQATKTPLCQDTGLAVIFADVGQEVHIVGGAFEDAVNEGVRKGYVEGYLRKSSVAEPLFERKNTGDNTPAVLHVRIVPGDRLVLRLAPKGAGSENKSVVKMLVPADGIEGVVVQTIYSDDYMVLSMISEEEAEEIIRRCGEDISEASPDVRSML